MSYSAKAWRVEAEENFERSQDWRGRRLGGKSRVPLQGRGEILGGGGGLGGDKEVEDEEEDEEEDEDEDEEKRAE